MTDISHRSIFVSNFRFDLCVHARDLSVEYLKLLRVQQLLRENVMVLWYISRADF